MFFIISKVLNFLIKPLVWLVFSMLLTLLTKHPAKKRNRILFSIFIFWFFSNTFTYELAYRIWEPENTQQEHLVYDYGIVLGGMSYYNEELDQISFLRASDRLLQAMEAYKAGKIKKIIITGGSGSILHHEIQCEGNYLCDFLERMGIPADDIISEAQSKNTRENAVFTKEILDKRWGDKYLLFTSAFHMRRSEACFSRVGMSVDTHVTDSYIGRPRNFFGKLLIPNDEAITAWTMIIKEWVGYVAYWATGYI